MRYDRPIQFNRNPITSSRPLRKLGRNLFWSLGVPVVLTLIALILSGIAQQNMFIVEGLEAGSVDFLGTTKNIMSFVKTMTLTLLAALALNSNLNSGRMDFSLGATGILASLLAFQIVPSLATIQDIVLFTLLTMVFGMVLGLIHSFIFIILKLPPIVTSLGMCLIYEGIAKVIAGSNNQVVIKSSAITSNFFLEPIIIIPILILVMLIMSFAFCYTKFGYDKNALVYDQKISVDTGIKEIRNCIVCYILAGALIGLYQTIDLTGQSMIQIKTDLGSSSTVFKNFLPIFIGGIIAKYNNQIVGLTLAVFSTSMLTLGMDAATSIGFTADVQSLINGFSVFAVLVYMVDKMRFINWVKMKRYLAKEKYLNPVKKGDK